MSSLFNFEIWIRVVVIWRFERHVAVVIAVAVVIKNVAAVAVVIISVVFADALGLLDVVAGF